MTIRSTFTFQEDDIEKLEKLTRKVLGFEMEASRSMVLRAGIHVLDKLSDKELEKLIKQIPKVAMGRKKQQDK